MKTPAGKECKFYYEDFHRGRERQECRLLQRTRDSLPWQPADCYKCPVPDILWANACEDMKLELKIKSGFLGLGRKHDLSATCLKTFEDIEDPMVGCSECTGSRVDLSIFFGEEGEE